MADIVLPLVLTDEKTSELAAAVREISRARHAISSRMADTPLRRQMLLIINRLTVAVRIEVRRYCPAYKYAMPDEGMDWTTDCRSGQVLSNGTKLSEVMRPGLCETCMFYSPGFFIVPTKVTCTAIVHVPKQETD